MNRKVVLGVVAAVGAATFVFLIVIMVSQGLARAGAWALPLAALAGIVAAVAAVWVTIPAPSKVLPPQPKESLPPGLEVPEWAIDRPAELNAVIEALLSGPAGTVGITTGLHGAGGFGKTTLARMVGADPRVRQSFGGRIYLVTVGRDVRGTAAIAAKINDVIHLVTGENATFTDPQLAGQRLGSLLDAGPRRLLVLDDVWDAQHLAPFTQGGKGCARLVTTRVPELLAGQGTAVRVDQMSEEQARALLTSRLPPLEEAVVAGLLEVTGRWPLLLRLVSQILADYAQVAADVSAVSAQGRLLLERLAAGGPAVVDELAGVGGRGLDVGQPDQRARAVRATIEASTSLLDGQEAERFSELSVFAEDEMVPFSLVATLWRATASLEDLQAAQVCKRLAQLALVSQVSGPAGGVALHDVIRDFLRAGLGQRRLAELNLKLLDGVAAGLPAASPIDRAAGCPVRVAWWDLGHQDQYLWDHLVEHLREAGQPYDAEAVASDLRWVGARLQRFGPAAPAADLAAAGTPRAARLRSVLERTAHLLAATVPAGAVEDVLHSRVANDPDWGPQVTALGDSCRRPRLVNRWPLPDLADPALQRGLAAHVGGVAALVVASDGSWLATGGQDGTVRIWDAATGQERTALAGHAHQVSVMAIAPDGSWLATGAQDGTVRIWDAATGQERAALAGHAHQVSVMAIAPDGSWLATGAQDGTVRIWDAATGQERAVLEGHVGRVWAVAIAPDGSWLATGAQDGTVRIWDAATGQERAVLEGHVGRVRAVAIAPDGSWLATSGRDRKVRIWDAATGQQQSAVRSGPGEVTAITAAPDGNWLAIGIRNGKIRIWDLAAGRRQILLSGHIGRVVTTAAAPDGSWLATGGQDGTVRIWDVAAMGRGRAALTGHESRVWAVAVAPDGSWLATGGQDGTVRIWDAAAGLPIGALRGHAGPVAAVTAGPDRSWLATGAQDGTVRIWDAATGQERAVLTGHARQVWAVAVAPDGSWLATGGQDGTVRIWDAATGQERAVLEGHARQVWAVAIAPDGSWLATGGQDGTVRIWDAATGQERAVLAGHARQVWAVAIAPDGSWLATGGQDGTVRIWDAATGQERAALEGHPGGVRAVAVAPDGSWLATGGQDRTVRIWDAASGQCQALMRLEGNVNALAWLDSEALVVGGSGGLYLFGFLPRTSPPAGQ